MPPGVPRLTPWATVLRPLRGLSSRGLAPPFTGLDTAVLFSPYAVVSHQLWYRPHWVYATISAQFAGIVLAATSTRDTGRTASAKNASNYVWCAVGCGSLRYVCPPGFGNNSREL